MRLLQNLIKHRIWWISALCAVIGFFLVQFILSLAVRHYANEAINSYPGLAGEIGSVNLYFIPGKYVVKNVRLLHTEGQEQEILRLDELRVRVYWKSLFLGAIEGDAWVESPQLTIWAPPKRTSHTKKDEQNDKKAKKPNWQDQMRALVPFKINTFEIDDGVVFYRDLAETPPIQLKIEDISLVASNLTNREELKDEMFAKTSVRAKLFESGQGEVDMVLDPLATQPTFKLRSAIKSVDLTKLNDFFMAYGKFDVDRGSFSLFSEIAAKEGKFVAYAKPVFRNIDVAAWESREHRNNKLLVLWKNIVGLVVDILKNKKEDQIATKFKAEGTFDDPDLSIWDAVATLLRNGFVQALIPGYDNAIKWTDVPVSESSSKE